MIFQPPNPEEVGHMAFQVSFCSSTVHIETSFISCASWAPWLLLPTRWLQSIQRRHDNGRGHGKALSKSAAGEVGRSRARLRYIGMVPRSLDYFKLETVQKTNT